MNKVLHRPLFRQAALKKGSIKPIRRANGGGVLALPPIPMQGPPRPTFTQNLGARMSRFGQRPSVRFGKELFSIPVQLGFPVTILEVLLQLHKNLTPLNQVYLH